MWRDKRVLVTGGAGVIGRGLIQGLFEQGAKVTSIDIQPMRTGPGITHRVGDVLGYLYECEEQDIVFHLAASFQRTEIESGFFNENFYNNVDLTHKLLASNHKWKKFIFASSYLVYDPSLYIWRVGHSLQEGDSIKPRNIVGAAKYYTENELEFIDSCSTLQGLSARIFRVYGRGSKDIISRTIRQVLRGEVITIYDQNARFDYIFADDVAEGLIKLAETSYSGPVNLACGRSRSVEEVLGIIRELMPLNQIVTRHIDNPSSMPLESSRADMTLFKDLTGWIPSTPLEVGIRKVIEYEREQLQNASK